MKTKNIICTLFFFALFLGSQKTLSQITAGAGLAFGTNVNTAGITVNGQYFINEKWAIAPDFIYYFPRSGGNGFNLNWYEINANGNYYFVDGGVTKFYGLAGLNLSIVSIPSLGFAGVGSSASNLGFNLGGGADFDISSSITPFAQLKYTLSSFNQLVITAGVRYTF
ncbi:hypothetical protein [Maribacter sp. 2307ULW6-5]|uniref:hypothetical protein n=1 Tax=Maribacter sp. 2307ULW6-5 TaxID=3386275 RepID=UPI0039BD4324